MQMRRREFITLIGSLVVAAPVLWTAVARAQGAAKLWRVGIILEGSRNREIEGFVQGMHELGHAEGRDYLAEWRFANGRYVRFPEFAQDFVRLKVDVIFVETAAAVEPVRQVTRSIPIVMGYSIDPLGSRLIANLARPGGNVTGMAGSREPTWPKQIELLKAALPGLSRTGILLNPESSDYPDLVMNIKAAADASGIVPLFADARDRASLESAFARMTEQQVEGVIVGDDGYFFAQHHQLAELALKHRLPSIYGERDYVQAGGLMSYGENLREAYRRAASFVDRIFKGAKAAELPIEQVPRQFVINHKTAAALGIVIPPDVYRLADEVIE
jgi:putative tryptophan/tyrosine transport system substrate-binding protein